MKKVILFITCLFCLGCHASKQTESEKTLITSDNFDTVVGMQWILEKMTVDGQESEPIGEKPYLQFADDGKVNGFAGINRFFGAMQIDAKGLVQWPDPLGATRMAGPPKLMDQEEAFLTVLPKTERFSTSGIHLYAASKDEKIQLVFFVPVK